MALEGSLAAAEISQDGSPAEEDAITSRTIAEEDGDTTGRIAGDGGEESAVQELLNTPHSRLVGGTEHTWCRAVSGGTGISILAMLFSSSLDASAVQRAIDKVQMHHPRLRSQLIWIQGKPAFLVSSEAIVKLEILDALDTPLSQEESKRSEDGERLKDGVLGNLEDDKSLIDMINRVEEDMSNLKSEAKEEDKEAIVVEHACHESNWMDIVEIELNTNNWSEQHHCLDPKPMFAVRLYQLPRGRSLLVLRLHTAVCDRTSASTILTELLHSFYEIKHGSPLPQTEGQSKGEINPSVIQSCDQEGISCAANGKPLRLMAMEDAIPKGKANKPFWAHGIDILGYSLGSRRHATLPFQEANQLRRSEIVRASLNVEHTRELLQMCRKQRTTPFGALSAAGLKATAICKQLGNRSEHFAMTTLVDCRNLLDPVLSDSTVGFYHSAILNTQSLNESVDFWDIARRCSNSLDNALKNRKHFTDMGDVNYLMCQAIQFPQLTPASSLRTSLMVLFEESALDDNNKDLKKAVDLEDYVGCSSVHGVGPSIAVFDTIQHGVLNCTCVYPAPLHSRSQIERVLNTMMSIIIEAVKQ